MPEPPDPLFARKLKESFAACHALALSVPDPVRRVNDFGRHLVFFKCAKVREYLHVTCSPFAKIITCGRNMSEGS